MIYMDKVDQFLLDLSPQLMSKLGKKFVMAWQLQHISDNFIINWPDQSTLCHAKIQHFATFLEKLKYKLYYNMQGRPLCFPRYMLLCC